MRRRLLEELGLQEDSEMISGSFTPSDGAQEIEIDVEGKKNILVYLDDCKNLTNNGRRIIGQYLQLEDGNEWKVYTNVTGSAAAGSANSNKDNCLKNGKFKYTGNANGGYLAVAKYNWIAW